MFSPVVTSVGSEVGHVIPKNCLFFSISIHFRCCRVCKKWNMVASSPVLWKSIDLSFMGGYSTAKDDLISSIITTRNLGSQIESLNLSGWKKLTSSALEVG